MTSTPWDAYGEDGGFIYANSPSVSFPTASPNIRPSYVRIGVQFIGTGSATRVWPKGGLTSGWCSSRVWCDNGNGSSSTNPFWGLLDTAGVLRIFIILAGNSQANGNYNVYKVNAAGATTLLGTTAGGNFSAAPTSPDKFDCNFNYSATGSLALYVNGSSIFTYSGDITTDGVTEVGGTLHGNFSPGYGTSATWSEHYVDGTQSTVGIDGVYTQAATGAGTLDQWTGVYTNVNETTVNDANFDQTAVANQVQRYTQNTVAASGILAVFTELRALAGPLPNLKLVQLIGGTEYMSASQTPPGNFTSPGVQYVQTTSPASGIAWQASELSTGFESGYEAL